MTTWGMFNKAISKFTVPDLVIARSAEAIASKVLPSIMVAGSLYCSNAVEIAER